MDRLRRALTTHTEKNKLKKRDEMISGKRSRSCEYVKQFVSSPNQNYSFDNFYEICDIIMNFDFYSLCSKERMTIDQEEEEENSVFFDGPEWDQVSTRVFQLFMYLLFKFQRNITGDKYRFAPIKEVILEFYGVLDNEEMFNRMKSFLDLFENCYKIIEEAIKGFPDIEKLLTDTSSPLQDVKMEFFEKNGGKTIANVNMWSLIMYMYKTKYLRYPTEEPAAHLPSRRRNFIPSLPEPGEDILFNSYSAEIGGRKSKKRGYKKRSYKKRSYKKRSYKKRDYKKRSCKK